MSSLKIEDLSGIQGDILLNGFPKKVEIFCFLPSELRKHSVRTSRR